jgi:hypothetical protein
MLATRGQCWPFTERKSNEVDLDTWSLELEEYLKFLCTIDWDEMNAGSIMNCIWYSELGWWLYSRILFRLLLSFPVYESTVWETNKSPLGYISVCSEFLYLFLFKKWCNKHQSMRNVGRHGGQDLWCWRYFNKALFSYNLKQFSTVQIPRLVIMSLSIVFLNQTSVLSVINICYLHIIWQELCFKKSLI